MTIPETAANKNSNQGRHSATQVGDLEKNHRDRVRRELDVSRHLEWAFGHAYRLGRRRGIPQWEAEDFAAWVVCRLLARDCAILESCRQPRRRVAYLRTVIGNLLNDYRNHLWGKWRPSATAERLGTTAVELECLCRRDGFSLGEAITALRANHSSRKSCDELEALASLLPDKPEKRFVPLDDRLLEQTPEILEPRASDQRHRSRERVFEELLAALGSLEHEDAEILRSHYLGGQSLASIARQHDLNQRALYSRRDRCLRDLRRILERDGLRWHRIAPFLTDPVSSVGGSVSSA